MIKKNFFVILNKFVYADYNLIFEALRDDGFFVSLFFKSGLKRKLINFLEIGNVIVSNYVEKTNFIYPKDVDLLLEYHFSFHKQNLDSYYFFMDLINITRKISKNFSSKDLFLNLLESLKNADKDTENLISYYNDFLIFCLSLLGIDLSIINICDTKLTKNSSSFRIFFNEKTNELMLNKDDFAIQHDVKVFMYDEKFKKFFLQRLFIEKISSNIKLNF